MPAVLGAEVSGPCLGLRGRPVGAHRDAGQQQPGIPVRGQPGAGHLLRFVLIIVKHQEKTKIHSLPGPEMLDRRGVHLQGQRKDCPGSARSVGLSHVSASFRINMNPYKTTTVFRTAFVTFLTQCMLKQKLFSQGGCTVGFLF